MPRRSRPARSTLRVARPLHPRSVGQHWAARAEQRGRQVPKLRKRRGGERRSPRTIRPVTLPSHSRPTDEVLAELRQRKEGDARWRDGRTFGLVYDAGPEVEAIGAAAAGLYL